MKRTFRDLIGEAKVKDDLDLSLNEDQFNPDPKRYAILPDNLSHAKDELKWFQHRFPNKRFGLKRIKDDSGEWTYEIKEI